MAWIKCLIGSNLKKHGYVKSDMITSIWCKESTIHNLSSSAHMVGLSVLVTDSGNNENVIYNTTLTSDLFEHKKDMNSYYGDAKDDWTSEIVKQQDEYMKEIIIEISKQIDVANKNIEHTILDFSTLKLHK
ncbi:MAG: hypothetical protein WC626_12610 [Methanoregula sp.]